MTKVNLKYNLPFLLSSVLIPESPLLFFDGKVYKCNMSNGMRLK